ncbi:hypothetical protein KSP39_PZI017914 [Platanthera zijinensis]|uniref:Retrotransposon Copia-like N-terminal domain-containing protein n=1 Tax=Platanthera zijinensis TaxID=2320716 RepID=A0AAP0FZP7_9ASPA
MFLGYFLTPVRIEQNPDKSLQLLRLAVDHDCESAPGKLGKNSEDLNSVDRTESHECPNSFKPARLHLLGLARFASRLRPPSCPPSPIDDSSCVSPVHLRRRSPVAVSPAALAASPAALSPIHNGVLTASSGASGAFSRRIRRLLQGSTCFLGLGALLSSAPAMLLCLLSIPAWLSPDFSSRATISVLNDSTSTPVPSLIPPAPPLRGSHDHNTPQITTIRLDDSNYLSWLRSITLALKSRRLFGYVNGTTAEPEKTSPDRPQ